MREFQEALRQQLTQDKSLLLVQNAGIDLLQAEKKTKRVKKVLTIFIWHWFRWIPSAHN